MYIKDLFDQINKTTVPPVLHGNGFLQFQLDGENAKRVHIWSSVLPRQQVSTQIHNHTFGFESKILFGTLLNQVYSVTHANRDVTHYVCEAIPVPNSKDTDLVEVSDDNLVRIKHKYVQVLAAGDVYDMCPFEYHESMPISDLVVTYMTKTIRVPNFKARVLCRIGEKPDNDFSRHALDMDLAHFVVERALKLIKNEYQGSMYW